VATTPDHILRSEQQLRCTPTFVRKVCDRPYRHPVYDGQKNVGAREVGVEPRSTKTKTMAIPTLPRWLKLRRLNTNSATLASRAPKKVHTHCRKRLSRVINCVSGPETLIPRADWCGGSGRWRTRIGRRRHCRSGRRCVCIGRSAVGSARPSEPFVRTWMVDPDGGACGRSLLGRWAAGSHSCRPNVWASTRRYRVSPGWRAMVA
jgi:hypothetical protein